MGRTGHVLGLTLLGLTGFGTGSAAAQLASPHKTLPTAHFGGTNGYDVTVSATDDSLLLAAEASGSRVTYVSSDSQSTRKRLAGTFGSAGSIRMEFHGRGRPRDHRFPDCDGTYTTRQGVWRGSMTFLGSGAFTTVAAVKAPGRIVTRFALDCGRGGGGEEDPPRTRNGHFLNATTIGRGDETGVSLDVHWLKGQRRARVSATVDLVDGPASVSYEVLRRAPRDRVHLSVRRGRARVDPGGPFAGFARYRASDEDVDIRGGIPSEPGPTWIGNLAVSMPGLGLIPLTGSDFKTIAGGLTVISL